MQLSVEGRGSVQVLRVREAKLTYPGLSVFFAEVRKVVEAGCVAVVLDLGAVSYIDSASIGCLMDVHRLLTDKGGAVRLSGLQPRVETMLSMTGIHRIIEVFRDEEAAVASFGSGERRQGDA